MILRDGCSPSYDLASLFHGKRNSTLEAWGRKIRLHPNFNFEGNLAALFLFWLHQFQKIEDASQNFIFLEWLACNS
jgi:hypothetical protein